jgi:hypothetical protein
MSRLLALQLFLLRRAMEHGPGALEVESLWRTVSAAEFLRAASKQICNADNFPPWQFIVDVCTSSESSPVSEFEVSPLWKHHPSYPARTVFASDSCLSAYNDADEEIILVAKTRCARRER